MQILCQYFNKSVKLLFINTKEDIKLKKDLLNLIDIIKCVKKTTPYTNNFIIYVTSQSFRNVPFLNTMFDNVDL